MHSLRARLVVRVVALAALGLVVLAAVTYFEQRSFLMQRVDQQARAAPFAMSRLLAAKGIGPQPRPDGDHHGGPPGQPGGGADGGPGRGDFNLPPGTYGEHIDADGHVAGSAVISYGQRIVAHPALPARIQPGRLFTVGGKNGDHRSYRVLAVMDPVDGGLTVAAVPLTEVHLTLARLLTVEGLVIVGILAALGLAAWAVVRAGLLPLDRMGHTAGAIAGGDLSHRVEETDPRSEVGRLGIALNAMLDRLEEAFAERQASENKLRQFLADASHELRTPLASIRGYAELYRMGAASDPGEVGRAMRRIEDEAARMGVLVSDLLTLARLDEVADAPPEEVDVAELARDAVDDARAVAPERDISLDEDVGGDAVAIGQPDQLRQVLANLLRNALVHTPDGTPIDVSVTRRDGEVRAEVRDHGPGLPSDVDPATLFERFWRAEGGRERGRDGAGLGLAIVAGIVGAHGGRVEAANAPGGGAAFVVHLPAAARGARRAVEA